MQDLADEFLALIPSHEIVGTVQADDALLALVREQGPVPMKVVEVKPDGTALVQVMTCPYCRRPLDPKLRCWKCCVRICGCGAVIATAFISVCRSCEVKEAHARGERI
jgi:hypothetical protein